MCAGVNAAIAKALKLKDVYCLHELVHNEIVIGELKDLGFRFVERIEDVPEGETVVFSAHGVSPRVREIAAKRKLKVVDTTCPFVAKVHRAAKAFSNRGLPVVILGDPKHVEVQGIQGEIDARRVQPGNRIGVVSQTTMNADEVERQVAELRKKYDVETMAEVCHATKERQDAVKRFDGDAVLVLGSRTSSNSKRLKEVAEQNGAKAFMAGSMDELKKLDFNGVERLGVTSGASTPERFFMEAVKFLRNVPEHVAIIMDGNGRWATQRGLARSAGHVAGAKTLERLLKWCGARQIRYVTVYAFSTENWRRSRDEVSGLMRLFATMIRTKAASFVRQKVRFRVIGRRNDLPPALQRAIAALEQKTAAFERELIVCLSYGGRAEIVDAANRAIEKGERVTEETFRDFLYAPDVPDPDLVIRTSGECRVSNFLLWQSAYAEYHFTDVLWPDFSEEDLNHALASYALRSRRRGAEQ